MQSTGERLGKKLIRFANQLDSSERFNLRLLMSVALGGVAPNGKVPRSGRHLAAWEAGVRLLETLTPAGLAYVGRPRFLSNELLSSLQREAAIQEQVAHRTGPQELSPGGEIATNLAFDSRLIGHVERLLRDKIQPTGISSYLYYNRKGDHLFPHVDTEIFAVNCIILLEHRASPRVKQRSALQLFKRDGGVKRIELAVGEMAVLRASGSVHGREPVKSSEKVTILTIGLEAIRRATIA